MATYVNNLRLKEIATGAESGTWGTSTNTNLELIADAFGSGTEAITTNADTHTTTIADGSADEGRAVYMKYTGTLDSTCTITLAPNTINKLWIIENATSGSQDIAISQGSGANVTIGNGKIATIFTDGAGSGAAVLDAFTDLVVTDSFQVAGPTLTVGDAAAEDTKLLFDGNAKDFYVGLDDSADKLVIGEGSTVGTNNILTITDDTVTIGDAAATDTAIVFDGNAQDFYIGLDDSADDLVIGLGSTVGTTPAITIDEDQKLVFPAAHVTIGDGTAEDTALIYNGNAQDFYIGLDDSADDLIIGLGSTVGTTAALGIDADQNVTITNDLIVSGAGPHAIGGATNAAVRLSLLGSYTSSGVYDVLVGTESTGVLTGVAGDTSYHAGQRWANQITTQASETIAVVTQGYFKEPAITKGSGATVTTASTVYIADAPTEGGTNNAALYVAAGSTQLKGSLLVEANTNCIGGAVDASSQLHMRGSLDFSAVNSSAQSLQMITNLIPKNGYNGYGMLIAPTFTEGSSGNHVILATARFNALTTSAGSATITNTSTVYIAGAATATVSGTNYSLWVDAGPVRMDGLPTSDPSDAGQLWNDSGTVKVSAG